MTALLPPLPGSEPLDRRVAAAFIALTLLLLAPSLPGVFAPTNRQDLADVRDNLTSQARQVTFTIDNRGRLTEPYFRTAVTDLGERAAGIHDELEHRAVVPDAATERDTLSALADSLAMETDALATSYGDDAALSAGRSRVQAIEQQLEGLGG